MCPKIQGIHDQELILPQLRRERNPKKGPTISDHQRRTAARGKKSCGCRIFLLLPQPHVADLRVQTIAPVPRLGPMGLHPAAQVGRALVALPRSPRALLRMRLLARARLGIVRLGARVAPPPARPLPSHHLLKHFGSGRHRPHLRVQRNAAGRRGRVRKVRHGRRQREARKRQLAQRRQLPLAQDLRIPQAPFQLRCVRFGRQNLAAERGKGYETMSLRLLGHHDATAHLQVGQPVENRRSALARGRTIMFAQCKGIATLRFGGARVRAATETKAPSRQRLCPRRRRSRWLSVSAAGSGTRDDAWLVLFLLSGESWRGEAAQKARGLRSGGANFTGLSEDVGWFRAKAALLQADLQRAEPLVRAHHGRSIVGSSAAARGAQKRANPQGNARSTGGLCVGSLHRTLPLAMRSC
eukprot:scaffold3575_cov254-Pinguiococcus_pyrenoidosus.AAC.3